MHPASSVLAVFLSCWVAFAASASCEGGNSLPSFAGKPIVLAHDALFFRTDTVQLDIDGSPSAYGVRDQGLEDICNGLGPLQPPQCKGKNKGPCYAACQQAFREWSGDPATLGQSMCSIGLGGGGCAPPRVRLQPEPRQQFFVSESSVHLKVPPSAQISSWVGKQEAQLDSLTVPYFVIPSGIRKMPWDATPGDVGMIIKQPGGDPIPFIVGDVGGALDEASAKLLASLRGLDGLPRNSKHNAFGEHVERLVGAMYGDFRVAIFRHSAPYASATHQGALVLDKSGAELADFIRDTATTRLQAIGGTQRLIGCTD
jgi:hypothetical protein